MIAIVTRRTGLVRFYWLAAKQCNLHRCLHTFVVFDAFTLVISGICRFMHLRTCLRGTCLRAVFRVLLRQRKRVVDILSVVRYRHIVLVRVFIPVNVNLMLVTLIGIFLCCNVSLNFIFKKIGYRSTITANARMLQYFCLVLNRIKKKRLRRTAICAVHKINPLDALVVFVEKSSEAKLLLTILTVKILSQSLKARQHHSFLEVIVKVWNAIGQHTLLSIVVCLASCSAKLASIGGCLVEESLAGCLSSKIDRCLFNSSIRHYLSHVLLHIQPTYELMVLISASDTKVH